MALLVKPETGDNLRCKGCPLSSNDSAAPTVGALGNKRHFVFRAPPGFAAAEFAAKIGIIDVDPAAERIVCITLGHGGHQLVLEHPCRGIVDPEQPLQGQSGQPGLGLADEVDRQKPNRQRQTGALEERPGGQ